MARSRVIRSLACGVPALALGACLDLDELRDRAAEDAGPSERAACEGDPRSIRIWTLHLGKSDFITLKNPTECTIDLDGLQLFFDDNEELALGEEYDCHVLLPPFRLPPRAEVRVHEHPLPGDIGVIEHKISACEADFSFNPERGGVSYLCDGPCDEDSVIDMVAHAGDQYGVPALRFGQRFDVALEGVTGDQQDALQYRRVALRGAPPAFFASDYALERRRVYASFEDQIDVMLDGASRAWIAEQDGQTATFASSTATAAVGNVSLSLTHRGNDGRSRAFALAIPRLDNASPTRISYFTRVDKVPTSAGHLELQGREHVVLQAGFEPSGLGTEHENGQRTEVEAQAKTWYQVELRNLDWEAHRFDLYVDRVMAADGIPFLANEAAPDRLELYSSAAGSVAYWDEIEIWH